MTETLVLNTEEIIRLNRLDDPEGYAWVLYVWLKRDMDLYTGMSSLKRERIDSIVGVTLSDHVIEALVSSLHHSGLISRVTRKKESDLAWFQLPIAYGEVCLEPADPSLH
jgi:hypothetical protein